MERAILDEIGNVAARLYEELRVQLADGLEHRIDYAEIARKLGCARNTVKNNVGKLLRAGLIRYGVYGFCLAG